jgi:CO/xanthine dehydrogenase Mo-binding subunit
MDMMAEALGLDPLKFRMKNVLREGDTRTTGEPLRDPRGIEVLERIGQISGWRRAKPRPSRPDILIGRGLALGDRHIGSGESTAELFLEPDGSLRLATAVRDVGVGAHTMHRQVTAEVLGVDPELIRIAAMGTDGPYDEGVRGQRGTHIEGQAVHRAATALVEALRRKAADLWKVSAEQVSWNKGRARLRGSKKTLTLAEVAHQSNHEPLHGLGHCKGGRPEVYAFQALAAEVEVDRGSGQVGIRRLYLALDATKVINPTIYQGQIDGAAVQGLGFSLMENMATEDGKVLTLNLGDYKIPTIRDVPPLVTSRVKALEGPGPFGAKSVAEAAIGIIGPAIANAVYDATGVRIKEAPITAEKIRAGLKEKNPG